MTDITNKVIDDIVAKNVLAKDTVELDRREDATESCTLLWNPSKNTIYIMLTDKQYSVSRVYLVPNEKARHAFIHPHCYKN